MLDLLAAHGDEAKPLAGGQSLVPMLALRLARAEHLVDLNGVGEMASIEATDTHVRIGAMTRQAAVAVDPAVAASVPLLALATPHIGHVQIRNRGTVGGSMVHADPAAEYPTVATALEAEIEVSGSGGGRTIASAEFFEGPLMTSLQPDELVTAIRFPIWSGHVGFEFLEVARRHGDFALVGVAVGVELGSSTIERCRIAMLGVEGRPRRAVAAEAAVTGASARDLDTVEVGRLALEDLRATHDIHASAEYRRLVGAHLVSEALISACRRAGERSGG